MLITRPLGKTHLSISPLSLGTVKFGRTEQVRYPTAFELPDDDALSDLIFLSRDLGINCLDTAPAYGLSEERLGKFFKHTGLRHEFILSTKVGERFEAGQSYFDFSENAVISSVENSLKKLNTDYLDLVFIHSDGNDLAILKPELIATLFVLKKQGKIRHFGLSGKTVEGGLATLEFCDVLMVTHNMHYTKELPVIEKAHQNQKGIFIKKALGSGHLFQHATLQEQFDFIFKTTGISSIVIGTLNPKHLREAAQATEIALRK